MTADLADPETPEQLVAAAREHFGRLDGALISVGGPPAGNAAAISDEQWRQSFETVFLGTIRAVRTVAAALSEGGAIGLVLSTSARGPVPGLGISNGLRPGLVGAAKDIADDYGPRGVRVVGLLPGRILTDRNRELFAATGDPERARTEAEAAIRCVASAIPPSSAGWPRSCSPPPRATSPGSPSRSTAARCAGCDPRRGRPGRAVTPPERAQPDHPAVDRLGLQETGRSMRPGHPDFQEPESINVRHPDGRRDPGTWPIVTRRRRPTRPSDPGRADDARHGPADPGRAGDARHGPADPGRADDARHGPADPGRADDAPDDSSDPGGAGGGR